MEEETESGRRAKHAVKKLICKVYNNNYYYNYMTYHIRELLYTTNYRLLYIDAWCYGGLAQ